MTGEQQEWGAERLAEKRDELRARAGESAESARVNAEARIRAARRDAEGRIAEGRARTAGAARRVADALDDAAGDMDRRGPAGPALGRAAASARGVADLIDDNTIGDAAAALGRFARRNPVAFLGAAAVTGFLVSRVATADSDEDRAGQAADFETADDPFDAAAPGRPMTESDAAGRPVASPTEAMPPRSPAPKATPAAPRPDSRRLTGGGR